MRQFLKVTVIAAVGAIALGSAGFAQDVDKSVKARKSLMQLYSHYMGTLGGMAKGAIDYDAEAAGAAANSLAALASVSQSNMWPQGSDNEAMGDKTRALPVIWTTFPAIGEKGKAFSDAAAAMAEVAGTDLASLQGAMEALGGSCGGCHKTYRQSDN